MRKQTKRYYLINRASGSSAMLTDEDEAMALTSQGFELVGEDEYKTFKSAQEGHNDGTK